MKYLILNRRHLHCYQVLTVITNNKYDIKCTQLSELSVPLMNIFTAIKHNKICITSESPIKNIEHQVWVYFSMISISTNGAYYHHQAITMVILVLLVAKQTLLMDILSTTNKIPVSTFDKIKHTLVFYHPNLLLVRSKPGVVTHLEHVP